MNQFHSEEPVLTASSVSLVGYFPRFLQQKFRRFCPIFLLCPRDLKSADPLAAPSVRAFKTYHELAVLK